MYDSYKFIGNSINSINKSINLQEIKEEDYPNISPELPNLYNSIKTINTNNLSTSIVPNDRYGPKTITTNSNEENDEVLVVSTRKVSKLKSPSAKFFSKVIIENFSSRNKLINLLERFLSENYHDVNYEENEENNRIEFSFIEEEVAFNFTKLLHQQKARTPSFYNIGVRLSLVPNKNFGKDTNTPLKRKGLSPQSIERLFSGFGVLSRNKEEKKIHKINGTLDLGISSPFLYPHERKKMKKEKTIETESGIRYKDYSHLPIRVLDAEYKPKVDYNYRPEQKNRWVSPANFKF